MLFDLKGKRKRLVQVVYVGLAILFGGGLVAVRRGQQRQRGPDRRVPGGNGGGSTTSAFDDVVNRANAAPRATPKRGGLGRCHTRGVQPRLLARGLRPRDGAAHRRGPAGGGRGSPGLEALREAEAEEAGPRRARRSQRSPTARCRTTTRRSRSRRSAPKSRPSPNGYFQLADFAYRADQTRKGRRSGDGGRAAHADGPAQHGPRPDQGRCKKQGKQIAKRSTEQKKAQPSRPSRARTSGAAFGPLPGQRARRQRRNAVAARPTGRTYNRPPRAPCLPPLGRGAVSSTGRAGDS